MSRECLRCLFSGSVWLAATLGLTRCAEPPTHTGGAKSLLLDEIHELGTTQLKLAFDYTTDSKVFERYYDAVYAYATQYRIPVLNAAIDTVDRQDSATDYHARWACTRNAAELVVPAMMGGEDSEHGKSTATLATYLETGTRSVGVRRAALDELEAQVNHLRQLNARAKINADLTAVTLLELCQNEDAHLRELRRPAKQPDKRFAISWLLLDALHFAHSFSPHEAAAQLHAALVAQLSWALALDGIEPPGWGVAASAAQNQETLAQLSGLQQHASSLRQRNASQRETTLVKALIISAQLLADAR